MVDIHVVKEGINRPSSVNLKFLSPLLLSSRDITGLDITQDNIALSAETQRQSQLRNIYRRFITLPAN